MPLISGRHIDRLIAAFNPLEGRAIIVPTRRGKRGNPVLWSKRFFPEMAQIAGDVGARHLIGEHAELVAEVEMDDDAILVDIDTPEALAALRAKGKPTSAESARAQPTASAPGTLGKAGYTATRLAGTSAKCGMTSRAKRRRLARPRAPPPEPPPLIST